MSEANNGHAVHRLELRVEPNHPEAKDDFGVIVLVDGEDILASEERFVPFDPWDLLGPDAPLLPPQAIPRVAIARCGCGNGGCWALAPIILERDDEVLWTDFGSFTGPYDAPLAAWEPDLEMATALDLLDLIFDAEQYHAEVRRASADYSWETPERRTLRLFVDCVDEQAERFSRIGWRLRPRNGPWSRPSWMGDRLHVVLQDVTDLREAPPPREICVQLTAHGVTPAERAASMADFLLGTPPQQWPRVIEGG